MRQFQAYGPEWDAAVANGSAPAVLTGAVFRGGWAGLVRSHPGNVTAWEDEWASGSDGSNNNWFAALEAFAAAAVGQATTRTRGTASAESASDQPAAHAGLGGASRVPGTWSSQWGDDVDRVVAGLDFLRRAQGSNGGFDGRPHALLWVGGPSRQNASGCLEGYGHRGPAEAVLLVMSNSTTAAQFGSALNGTFDDDGNPATPNVTRSKGYADLFRGSRDYLLANRGHAPN